MKFASHNGPFPGCTGRGIRVVVIDSGVNAKHPHIGSIAGGVSIEDGRESEHYPDFLGHGTAVMAAIQEKAPEAEYFAVKVFHASLRTSVMSLLRALEWAIEQRAHVVNLSLGTLNSERADHFRMLVARAAESGVTVVSAVEANGRHCFPGCLPGVIGVGVDWKCNRNRYRIEQEPHRMVFYASGYPRPLPGLPPERNLQGISFAVANMSGFVVRACQAFSQRRPDRISEALLVEAARFNTG